MRLDAILSQEDVADLVRKFVPLEVELGEAGKGERLIAIDEVSDVTLVADAGVLVACKAHLLWPVLGFHVPVRVKALDVLLRPRIEVRDGHRAFVCSLKIERADIAGSPAIVDENLTERVNRELAEHHVELSWDFAKTLSHVFRLPYAIRTAETFALEAVSTQVSVTNASLAMTITFRATVGRRVKPSI